MFFHQNIYIVKHSMSSKCTLKSTKLLDHPGGEGGGGNYVAVHVGVCGAKG